MKKFIQRIGLWLKKYFGPKWTAEEILKREG